MKTIIYYYTGTGNSLWTARLAAVELGNADVRPMAGTADKPAEQKCDAVGLVFPVHIWGVPSLVLRFIEELQKDPSRYYFAFAVNAGQVSRTLMQLRDIMKTHGLRLSAGYDIVLPSNYIPWGGPGPAEKREKLNREAREKIKHACGRISKKEAGPIEKGPLWQRVIFTALYKRTFSMVPKMDGGFWVDEKCNGCAVCEKVCPVGNIAMESDKPVWNHRCEQCLACIQWCPQEAIQYGKKTPAYERYHHPEVKVSDIIIR
ncbi:MAG: EFR1 family ferrodoxin [Spirochaetes bacterium]|nr:EFR1 family ferrodoxin [Spirochaetota bacterium]